MLKKTTLITALFISIFSFSQDKKSIIGEWKVVSIDNGEVYLNTKTDSVSTTPEFDKKYSNRVIHQDAIAEIRGFSSKNEFVFTENGEFQLYMNSKRNTKYLDGDYEFTSDNKLNLKVKGRTGKEMQKELEFEFIDNLLLVKFKYLATRKNKPTEYLLERKK